MLTPGGGRRGPGLWESSQAHLCRPVPSGGGVRWSPLAFLAASVSPPVLGTWTILARGKTKQEMRVTPSVQQQQSRRVDCFCPSRVVLGARSL